MASSAQERRQQVMLGDLPEGFLTIPGSHPSQQQIAADQQTAAMLQAGGGGMAFASPNVSRLSITVAQAKLTKNYGLTKMDPYCRIRVGHSVFETHTSHSGGKNPRWNKVFHCHVPNGVDMIYLEIFDERAFTMDDRVAWAHITVPPAVMNGDTADDWYQLNGKQGEAREGMINLIMSKTPVQVPAAQPILYTTGVSGVQAPVMMVPNAMPVYYPQQAGGAPIAVQQPPAMQQGPPQPAFTEEDVQQVKDMFPNMDEEVIKSVLEVNRGNKELAINNLLSMDS